jgi:hypothetical protein
MSSSFFVTSVVTLNSLFIHENDCKSCLCGQEVAWWLSVQEYRVSNVWNYASSYPYAFVMCTGTALFLHNLYQTRNIVIVHMYMLFLWLTFTAFSRNLKCVCFLFITVHCHFKNNVCFLTVYELVWHGSILPSISVTHLH